MSPLHVLISPSQYDEDAYGTAFTGAIDLYRFNSNVEAFERLTAVQQPVDVIVIVGQQEALFNMTAAQLAQRLVAPPLGDSTNLRNTQIVVVGDDAPGHMRIHRASTIDAAVRLIKFGEVESAPVPSYDLDYTAATMMPASPTTAQPMSGQFSQQPMTQLPGGSYFFDSVVSSIWSAADAAPAKPAAPTPPPAPIKPNAGPALPPGSEAPREMPVQKVQMPRGTSRMRGAQRGADSLFTKPNTHAATMHDAPIVVHESANEVYENYVRDLEASRPFSLPGRGVYRGPAPRKGSYEKLGDLEQAPTPLPTPGARHSQPQQPVVAAHPQQTGIPPQLAEQMQQLTYPPTVISDPVMGWSSAVQKQLVERPAPPQIAAAIPLVNMMPQNFAPMDALLPTPGDQLGQQMHMANAPRKGKKSRLGRLKDKVIEAERAPTMPNIPADYGQQIPVMPMVQQHAAPMVQHHAVQAQAPYPAQQAPQVQHQASGAFDAPDHLLRRADGDVSFG